MTLVPDVRVLALAAGWDAGADVELADGIDVLDPGEFTSEHAYRSGVYRPRPPWRAATDGELAALLGVTDGDPHQSVVVLDAPPSLPELYRDLALSQMARSSRAHREGKSSAFPFLIQAAEAWLAELFERVELCSAELNFTPAGSASSTYDASQSRYRGLHVDNWGTPPRPPLARDAAGIRVGVNVGDADRYLVFVNLRLPRLAALATERGMPADRVAALAARANPAALVEEAMRWLPGYPVTRIRIKPGQAYVAPVQNMLHDGLPTAATGYDANLQLSSNTFEYRAGALPVPSRPRPADHRPPALAGAGPLRLLIVQATPFCNIRCDYCYLPGRDDARRMNLDTVARIAYRATTSRLARDDFTVVWHAGEPLVMGVDFYEQAIRIFDEAAAGRLRVSHSIQTNGLLLDDRWCDLIRRHGIKLGLSIDGPAAVHDAHRVTRTGKGTHERVLRAVRLLRERDVPFSVISVFTADVLGSAREYVDFLVEHEIWDSGFNIEEIEGVHDSSSLSGREAEFRAFLTELYRLAAREPRLRVREFAGARDFLLYATGVRSSQATPFQQINVDIDGNFSTFSPELLGMSHPAFGGFVLGNVRDMAFEDALDTELFRRIDAEIRRGVDACRAECTYFSVCGGGAPANKLFELGTFAGTETLECRLTKKAVVDVVLAGLEAELAVDGSHA